MSSGPVPHALVLRHRARPGRRDALVEVWRRHMPDAVRDNDGHQAYVLCASHADPDVLLVFQQYRVAHAAAHQVELVPGLAEGRRERRQHVGQLIAQ